MIYIVLLIAVIIFMSAIVLFDLISRSKTIVSSTSEALEIMRSSTLSLEEKERSIQKASSRMMLHLLTITVLILVILALPTTFVYLLSLSGLFSISEAIEASTNIYFIIASIALAIPFFIWKK